GRVGGEAAACDRQRAADVVDDPAARVGGVAGDGTVAEGQCAKVVDAPADVCLAPGDGQATQGDVDGRAPGVADLEDAAHVLGVDGQAGRPRAGDQHRAGDG